MYGRIAICPDEKEVVGAIHESPCLEMKQLASYISFYLIIHFFASLNLLSPQSRNDLYSDSETYATGVFRTFCSVSSST